MSLHGFNAKKVFLSKIFKSNIGQIRTTVLDLSREISSVPNFCFHNSLLNISIIIWIPKLCPNCVHPLEWKKTTLSALVPPLPLYVSCSCTAKNRKSTGILLDKRYEKYPDDYVENLYEVFRVFPNGENMYWHIPFSR